MSKTKCYGQLHEVSILMHSQDWSSHDKCGKSLSKKLEEIIKLLGEQKESNHQ